MTRGVLALLLIGVACGESGTDACPDPADPKVRYIEGTREDPARCQVIRFACEQGETAFSNECGCGCMRSN